MNIGKFLFLTIHSKPIVSSFTELEKVNPGLSQVWKNYTSYVYNDKMGKLDESTYEVSWMDKASHVPEFCSIDSICLGYLKDNKLETKELNGSESDILTDFNGILNKVAKNDWIICGWNIKNYDIPLLNKRFFINRLKPNSVIPKNDTKPWEMKSIFDMKEFWNGTASRGINSIDALYYSVCQDPNLDLFETKDEMVNCRNRITKMFNITKELSNIE